MQTIELVLFRAKDGVTDYDMRRAAEAIVPDVKKLNGFVSRYIGCDVNGVYADIVIWSSQEAAAQAAQDVMMIPTCRSFFSLIDHSSIDMRHLG